MIRKIAIIANAAAGRGTAHEQLFVARSILWGRVCEFYTPRSIDELQSIIQALSPAEYDALVILGGDGTFNQAIRGIGKNPNQVPYFIFPSGTANDLAQELGLRADWNQVQTLVDQKSYDWIDLVEVNGIPFSTVAGIGIGATLTAEFNQRRTHSFLFKSLTQILKSEIYTALSAKAILTDWNSKFHLNLQAPLYNEQLKTPAVFFCNQTHLGGSLRVVPASDNTDSRFHVLVVTSSHWPQLLNSMIQMRSGKLPEHFFIFSTDHLYINDLNGKDLTVFGDGEILTRSQRLEFKILPRQLMVFREPKLKKIPAWSNHHEMSDHRRHWIFR